MITICGVKLYSKNYIHFLILSWSPYPKPVACSQTPNDVCATCEKFGFTRDLACHYDRKKATESVNFDLYKDCQRKCAENENCLLFTFDADKVGYDQETCYIFEKIDEAWKICDSKAFSGVRCKVSEECRPPVPIEPCETKITLRAPLKPGDKTLNQNDVFEFKAGLQKIKRRKKLLTPLAEKNKQIIEKFVDF